MATATEPEQHDPRFSVGRMGMCSMCHNVSAKYRCPACEMETCSVKCVKTHKTKFNCSSVRNKTKFVPMSKMNELHLLNDYRLLEELSRVADACTRDQVRKCFYVTHPQRKLQHAMIRRHARIYFLPPGFSRRTKNKTFWNSKTDKINWKLSLTFLHAKQYSLLVERCSEDATLDSVVRKCLRECLQRKTDCKVHFEAYNKAFNDVQVLMQAEKVPGAKDKMYLLDMKKSIRSNLVGKRIVEFPYFYVVINGFYSYQKLQHTGDLKKQNSTNMLLSNYCPNKNQEDDDMATDDNHKDSDSEDASDTFDDAIDCIDANNDILKSLYEANK